MDIGKKIVRYLFGTVLVLSIPLVAMQFSDGVRWNWFDFLVAGILLLVAGATFELITYNKNAKYRRVVATLVMVVLILIWAELAVGIFGSPIAGS